MSVHVQVTTAGRTRHRVLVGLAVVAVAVQLYGLYRPVGPPQPGWFPGFDKVQHTVGFGLPLLLILLALRSHAARAGRRWSAARTAVVVAVFVVHAVVSEVVQHAFYVNRSGDPFDVLADCVGNTLGTLAYVIMVRRAGTDVRDSDPDHGLVHDHRRDGDHDPVGR